MADWQEQNDREEGAWQFLARLDQDEKLRAECLADPAKAKAIFEETGRFSNMPAQTEVRILEDSKEQMDNLVIIALPRKGELPPRDKFRVGDAWLCCWNLWSPT
ncbi:MAG: hypothetical protein ACR2G0_06490 [Chthoniobacterales bacterium]